MFFFRTLNCARKEFDNYQWDSDHPDKPLKKNDHICDAVRYVVMARPHASELKPMDDARVELRKSDPGTAAMWDAYDKRVEARIDKKAGKHALATELFQEMEEN